MQKLNKDQIREIIRKHYWEDLDKKMPEATVDMILSSLLHFYPPDQTEFTYEELFIGALKGL